MRFRILPLLFVICALCSVGSARGQSWSMVKNSPDYYSGEGWAATVEDADQQALAMLISQINVNISTGSGQKNERLEHNGKLVSDNTTFQAAINTYSQATLDSTSMLIIERPPKAHVARWIKKSEVGKIFAARRRKITELVEAAQRAEDKGKVDVALKNWYWAFSLLKSLPKANSESYGGHVLMSWIPERIDDLLADVEVTALRHDGYDIEAQFTYKGKPVTSIDYTYCDGGFWSNLCSARDGVGLMQLSPGTEGNGVNVEIEVEYRGQAMLDPEIQSVMEVLQPVKLAKAAKFMKGLASTSPQMAATEGTTAPTATASATAAVAPVAPTPQQPVAAPAPTPTAVEPAPHKESFTDIEPQFFKLPASLEASATATYQTALDAVVKNMATGSLNGLDQYFTPEGLGIYNKLIRFGKGKVVGKPEFTFMDHDGSTSARGMKMSFSFHNGVRKNFVENVVFTFNKDNKIDNVAFGLSHTAENDILGQSAYPEAVRKLLVQFMENYQTAFALKRADYLERVFDDDALIIVGRVVKTAPLNLAGENYLYRDNKLITYNRLSKNQYLDNLKRSFASKEYINLRFNNIQIRRAANGGEIYGIQLEQDFYSSNYSDHGYLFLELNLNDMRNPLIMIRTWQPVPDKEFGVYDIDNFPIQKFDMQ